MRAQLVHNALRAFAVAAMACSCTGTTIHADFEGGSTGPVQTVSATHFRIGVKGETDQAGRNRQASWYYFRVDDAPRSELTFDLVDLAGEYNYTPNAGAISDKTPPVISYDRKTWTHIGGCEYDAKEPRLRVRIVPKASRFWIAHTPPYTTENLAAFRKQVVRKDLVREAVVGKSVAGRPLYLWTIGDSAGGKTVWLMFRQHSWESGSSWAAEGVVRELLREDSPGAALRKQITWKIYPMCDPDGVARGGVRFNANGYDLNRNWDVEDARTMPEITAQRKGIADWIHSGHAIDLFVTVHNTETSEYVEGPPDGDADAAVRALAERFFAGLSAAKTFAPTRGLSYSASTTTEGKIGRMNVVQGLYRDFKIPGFLIEQRIAEHPKLGRAPEIGDRVAFGRELVHVIARAVGSGRVYRKWRDSE